MRKINKYLLLFLTLQSLYCIKINAQLLYNNGAQITITDGGIVAVKTADAENFTGTIDNEGYFLVEGSLTNEDEINGIGANSLFEVRVNWINNSLFIPDLSTVLLNGDNQLIGGTVAINDFYNLTLDGTGIKNQGTDAQVQNVLNLNEVELATDFSDCFVLNPDPNSVLRGNGFVSSLDDGAFYRNTNSTNDYLFPLGSSLGTLRYRPVEIRPNAIADQRFGGRLVNNDPDFDGHLRDTRDTEKLCAINPEFYHYLYHPSGSDPADLSFYFNKTEDGDWTRLAHWQNVPRWEDMGDPTSVTLGGLDGWFINSWTDFVERPFALGHEAPTLDAGPDFDIETGETVSILPIYDGISIEEIDWTPSVGLNCSDCLSPDASPTITTLYDIVVTDELGCKARDTVNIMVRAGNLWIPTAFSPNEDGVNDVFKPINENLDEELYYMAIYNRWGRLVYETTDPTQGWDGIYEGEEQEIGVYVYYMDYKFVGPEYRPRRHKGDVTLVR